MSIYSELLSSLARVVEVTSIRASKISDKPVPGDERLQYRDETLHRIPHPTDWEDHLAGS